MRSSLKVKRLKVKVTRQINARCNVVNVNPFNKWHRGGGHTMSATQLVVRYTIVAAQLLQLR